MRTNYIDEDTCDLAYNVLDLIKTYKLMYDRGYIKKDFSTRISCNNDDLYCAKYEQLECVEGDIFGTECIEYHEANNPEDVMFEDFGDCGEYYDYESYGGLYSLVIKHPSIVRFMALCDKLGIDVVNTQLEYHINEASRSVDSSDWYAESYMEIFIPADKRKRDLYPLCFFYTDASMFNSSMLENYYDGLDYCDAVLKANPKTAEELLKIK